MKTLTVAELREKLATLDGNLEVFSDGCDCMGAAVGVNLYTESNGRQWILLCRNDGYRSDLDPALGEPKIY